MTEFYSMGNGLYAVRHESIVVAEGLSLDQAINVTDDYSYYGKVVNCVFDRSKPCKSNFKGCELCEEGVING